MATVTSTPFSSQSSFRRTLGFRAHFNVSCRSHKSSLSPLPKTLMAIENSGVIACLRAQSAELAREAAHAALEGGISVLEIATSTPGVFEVIQGLVRDHPTSVIGVGTVLNTKDARNGMKAGAKFLMSPATVKEISDDFHGSDVLYIPGVMTPTEILNAYNAGARIVKFFIGLLLLVYVTATLTLMQVVMVYPISALGGAEYISALKRPFSHIPMVASQGITIDSVETYIAQGASAVVLSDAIFNKEAMRQRNFSAIYELARHATLHGYEAEKGRESIRRCVVNNLHDFTYIIANSTKSRMLQHQF